MRTISSGGTPPSSFSRCHSNTFITFASTMASDHEKRYLAAEYQECAHVHCHQTHRSMKHRRTSSRNPTGASLVVRWRPKYSS